MLGFFLETTLKSLVDNILKSALCIRKLLKLEITFSKFSKFSKFNLLASIILKFFLFLNIFNAFFSIPFPIIISKNVLFNFFAN